MACCDRVSGGGAAERRRSFRRRSPQQGLAAGSGQEDKGNLLFTAGSCRHCALGDDDAGSGRGGRLAVARDSRSTAFAVRKALAGPGDACWRLAVMVGKALGG